MTSKSFVNLKKNKNKFGALPFMSISFSCSCTLVGNIGVDILLTSLCDKEETFRTGLLFEGSIILVKKIMKLIIVNTFIEQFSLVYSKVACNREFFVLAQRG